MVYLVEKWPFFELFVFRLYRQGKSLLRYCRTKKRPSRLKKQKNLKSRKIDFFPKGLTHGFGPKMAIFPTFFLRIIDRENVFYDILERKNACLGYKNEKFKKWKN